MAIAIRCTIELHNYPYEGGVEEEQIFEVSSGFSSTGSFASFGRKHLDSWVEMVSRDTKDKALNKLTALKGDK